MKLNIEGKAVDPQKLTYRQLGFGQKIKEKFLYSFELFLTISDFSIAIEKPFNLFVGECKKDDKETDGEDSIAELVQYNYPLFDKFMEINKHALSIFIKDFLFFELLEGCLDDNPVDKCSFAVNNIHSICIDENMVIIKGKAYSINDSVDLVRLKIGK